MEQQLLGISVEDVNGNNLPNAEVVVRDSGSTNKTLLSNFRFPIASGSSVQVFDLGNLKELSIELKSPLHYLILN